MRITAFRNTYDFISSNVMKWATISNISCGTIRTGTNIWNLEYYKSPFANALLILQITTKHLKPLIVSQFSFRNVILYIHYMYLINIWDGWDKWMSVGLRELVVSKYI